MGVPFLVGRCISGCVRSCLLNRRIAISASQEKSFLRGIFLAAEFCTVDRATSDRESGGHGGGHDCGSDSSFQHFFCMIIRVNGCICNKAGDEYT